MATGDLNGNLQRLLRELKAIKYPSGVDEVGLRLGDPVAFLPLLNFALIKFSRHVARFVIRNGFELAGKTDHRFIESSFRLFRDVLNVRTVLTPAQFFEQGFAERKVLLLCDVISVCKKLHNEEVRQERLAALKANRQEQTSNRLSAPRRASPSVKVVRNDDIEITTVLGPQHLPNSSDASQSVYKAKKTTVARSPSPSPNTLGPGKALPRTKSSPEVQHTARQGESLELTFRPAALAQPGQAPAKGQPPANRGAQPAAAQPIHYWFMNPAFDGNEEGGAEVGVGTGLDVSAEGRPDSSAWWLPSSSPPGHPSSTFWRQQGPLSAAAADAQEDQNPMQAAVPAAGGSSGSEAHAGRHLFYAAPSAAPAGAPATQAAASEQQRYPWRVSAQEPATVPARQGAASSSAAGPPLSGAAAAGSRTASGGGAFATRDLDEWSFSRYFGPGKVAPVGRTADNGQDRVDSSQELGGTDDDGSPRGQPDVSGAAASEDVVRRGADRATDDLERDGPAQDQDRRLGAGALGPPGYAHTGLRPPAWSTAAGGVTGQRSAHQRQPEAAQHAAWSDRGTGATAGSNGSGAEDWTSKLAQLERETHEQLQALQAKLSAAEGELEKTRTEAKQSRDTLQARVTVLEGRVRFLECELELCVKRQPGQEQSLSVSPERTSPAGGPVPRRELNRAVQAPAQPAPAASALPASGSGRSSSPSESRYSPQRPASADLQPAPAALAGHIAQGQPIDRSRASHSQAFLAAPGSSAVLARGTVSGQGAAGTSSAFTGGRQPTGNPPSFSPMPQPTFSFQPTMLMQQVASAASGSVAHPATGQQLLPSAGMPGQAGPSVVMGIRPYISSLDSMAYTLRQVPDGALPGSHGAHGSGPSSNAATDSTRLSLDSAARSSGANAAGLATDNGPGHPATSVDVAGGGAGGYFPTWRAAERMGQRHGTAASILDGVAGAAAAQLPGDQLRRNLPADGQRIGLSATASSTGPASVPATAAADSTGSGLMGSYALPPSSGAPSAGAGGAFRSTDDLINSLYLRYTEAQDFLQTLRKR